MSESAVIIGGGLGGLFTGAILAKEGMRVTVLEKNAGIGGGLQTFRRFGVDFDTGMHVVGGMESGGNIARLCRYLGIYDQAELMPVDEECSDLIYFADGETTYRLCCGRERFVERLKGYFPSQAVNIEAYVDAIYSMVDAIDLFNLRPAKTSVALLPPEFYMAADDFVAKYISDSRLRAVVAYMNPLYGGRRGMTPAYIHALISVLYINGTQRFVGGSARFAKLLANVITDAGGEVIAGDGVKWVEVKDRSVEYVGTLSGNRYTADWYISAIHPCTLFTLTGEKTFPKSYRDRLNSIPNSYSAFSVYVKFKQNAFPFINHSEYYMNHSEDIWEFGNADKPWPLGFLMMTPPDDNQGEFATRVLVTAPMLYDEVLQWENTKTGQRGKDYEKWKQERVERLLSKIEELHPGFRDAIDKINTASPLTIRDFYGVKVGALTGFSKDCRNLALSQVPVVTKVRNLLLTGQNNNLHGFCGVALTAIQTAEAIFGFNYIINKINGA